MATLLIGLLGGAVALIHDKIQDLSARVNYRVFDQRFSEVQFLLNTANSSEEHLKKGIDQATQAIAMVSDMVESPAQWDGWVQRLTPQEGRRLREQLIELMMLEARAQVSLASRHGKRDERDRSIERAIDRLDRAERIDPAPPSALFAERARYHALLHHNELTERDQEQRAADHPVDLLHDLDFAGDKPARRRRSPGSAELALREVSLPRRYSRCGPGLSWVIVTTRKDDSSSRPATSRPAQSEDQGSRGYTSTVAWRWPARAARSMPDMPTTVPSSSNPHFPKRWSTAAWSSSSSTSSPPPRLTCAEPSNSAAMMSSR